MHNDVRAGCYLDKAMSVYCLVKSSVTQQVGAKTTARFLPRTTFRVQPRIAVAIPPQFALPVRSQAIARIALLVHMQVALQDGLSEPARTTAQSPHQPAFRTTS
jgi:hypothetical protein